ncbi:hypothetical protein [Streptomyces sp. NBC_01244]|uniref:hypothetical protein n=1 Tax=Streptomyces sp. NBC_01244 TaxID=2903797 RepID=UPI002E1517B7|nr:hypothetical protein OG247_44510 [Streptomyces sp. NBC_01244]
MTGFPGLRPMTGDAVEIRAEGTVMKMAGPIVCQGFKPAEGGQLAVKLTLPDADPQQRRTLSWCKTFSFTLFVGGAVLYSSPPRLKVREIQRDGDGALAVTGSPS